MTSNDYKAIQTFKQQFSQQVPIKTINFDNQQIKNIELQEAIIRNTIQLEIGLNYPINFDYQRRFLKALIDRLELEKLEVSEQIYEEYTRLIGLKSGQDFYKHYWIENSDVIVVKEDCNLISEGTTGLHTWEAGLALSEWIYSNNSKFTNKTTLELGSGVGLAGLVLSLLCCPKKIYFSDCHPSVIRKLIDNITINGGKFSKQSNKVYSGEFVKNKVKVDLLQFDWSDCIEKLCAEVGKVDYLVAADVVFDSTIFVALISTITSFFTLCGCKELILCCKERNTETLSQFLHLLEKGFKIEELKLAEPSQFLWSKDGVRLFSVTS